MAEARDVVAAYDFGVFRSIIDVGGGRGVMLAAVLQAVPDATGVLLDRADVLPQARDYLDGAGLSDRIRLVPATSSPRCRRVGTRTCWPGSCTTGTTTPPSRSSIDVERP